MIHPIQEHSEVRTDWVKTQHRLSYYFGEFCAYRYEFPAVALAGAHFSGAQPICSSEAIGQLGKGINAAIYLSQPVVESFPRITLMDGAICYVPMESRHYYIRIDGSLQDYVQENFRAKPRHNMHRSIRLFETFSGGKIDFREFRGSTEAGQFYELARQVSRLTYQERMLKLGIPSTPEFVDLLNQQAQRDEMRGYVLMHSGRPVAYAYCRIQSDVISYLKIGHDPAFGKWSPGKILLYLILQRVFDKERLSIFDFGAGESHYKSFFSNESRLCANVYYFQKTTGNFVRIALHAGLHSLSGLIGRVLARFDLKERLRKFLRRSGTKLSAALLINSLLPLFCTVVV